MHDPLVESKTAEAANAAAVAEEARLNALEARLTKAFIEKMREEMSPDKGRYIDVSRVPLICQSIVGIDEKLDNMQNIMVTQDQFWPVKTLVYGFVGTILLAALVAVLALILKPHDNNVLSTAHGSSPEIHATM